MFTMLALIDQAAPDESIESLEERVNAQFGSDPGFTLEYETLPFKKSRNLLLRWPGWTARLCPEAGPKVLEESMAIAQGLGSAAPPRLAGIDRRIRAVYGNDPAEDYIDHMIELTQLLQDTPGAVVFDPQQNKIRD